MEKSDIVKTDDKMKFTTLMMECEELMGTCPYCGGDQFTVETVNQVEMKKCQRCGAFFEDIGREFPYQSFTPLCERDANGAYPFCPKCGCKEIRRLSLDECMIRGNFFAALLAGEPFERNAMLRGRYECRNPKCRHRWN